MNLALPTFPRLSEAQREPLNAQPHREHYIANGFERCLPCNTRGVDRPCVLTKKGRPTGLCRWHTDYEAELCRRLRAEEKAMNGKLSGERAKEVRDRLREETRARIAAERAAALLPPDHEDDEP